MIPQDHSIGSTFKNTQWFTVVKIKGKNNYRFSVQKFLRTTHSLMLSLFMSGVVTSVVTLPVIASEPNKNLTSMAS